MKNNNYQDNYVRKMMEIIIIIIIFFAKIAVEKTKCNGEDNSFHKATKVAFVFH